MKKTFKSLSNMLFGLLFFSIAMILVAAFSSCSPRVLPKNDVPLPSWFPVDDPTEIGRTQPDFDTIQWVKVQQLDGDVITISLDSLMNSDKIVIDTILIAGEEVIVYDSIPCPEGLTQDSFVTFTLTRNLPPRSVPVSVTVLDTVWLTKPCPTIKPAQVSTGGSSWAERIIYLSSIAALLIGYFREWRKKG